MQKEAEMRNYAHSDLDSSFGSHSFKAWLFPGLSLVS